MTITTSGRHPQHHVELEKDDITIALDLVDTNGKFDPLTVVQEQQPRVSIKMHQGGTTHADYEYPYGSTEQRDYSGGRGLDSRDDDETRFMDSYQCETWREGKALLGPSVRYATGYRNAETNIGDDTDFIYQPLWGSTAYRSMLFTASASYKPDHAGVFLRLVGNPDNCTAYISIYSDDSGEPNTQASTRVEINLEKSYVCDGLLSSFLIVYINGNSITQGNDYHVVVEGEGDYKNHYEVACVYNASSTSAFSSIDGLSWSSSDYEMIYRVTDLDSASVARFFEYRGALMTVFTKHSGSVNKMYLNGDYGTITASTTTTITDSTKSWTTNAFVGCVIKFGDGAGTTILDRTRAITSNTATSITFTPALPNALGYGAWYSVQNTDIWIQIAATATAANLTDAVTDVLSANNVIYVAQGDIRNIIRFFNPGLGDQRVVSEFPAAGTYLALAPDSEGRQRVWKADNRYTANVDKAYSLMGWYSMDRLDFGLNMNEVVVNGDMEADTTWAAVLTPTTEERSDTRSYQGTYSWHLVCDAINEGIYQTLTVNSGDTYQVFASIWVVSGSVTMELGGEVLATVSTTGEWVDVDGIRTVAAGTEDLEFLSNSSSAEFYVDSVFTIESPTYLTNIGAGKITNMIAYDDPQRLWAATDGGLYMEDNGDMLPVPLGEFASARDRRNGKAMLVHDIYLYLSFLDGLERYYKGNLDDVGPNRDEGLPENRRGSISDMVGYPGRIYAAVDPGGNSQNWSSILLYNGVGWHEVFRHPRNVKRIESMHIQPIEGDYVDRLWFSAGADIMYLDIDLKPETNSYYRYTPESMIETGWIYYGKRDVDKYWAKLKIYFDRMEGDTGEATNVFVQYKVDNDSDWNDIGTYTQVSGESKSIGDKVVGKRIKFRYVLRTSDLRYTPILISAVVEFIEQVDVKDSYQIPFLVQDNKITLQGRPSFDRLEDNYDKLKEWINSPSPVYVRSVDPRLNGKQLKPLELNSKLIKLDKQSDKTAIYCTLRMIEV